MEKIKVYSKPGCSNCMEAKNTISLNGLEFLEVDITKDESSYQRVVDKGVKALPLIEFGDGTEMIGFNRLELLKKLKSLKGE